ncbi:MAG: tRNA (adenosine(37)-N6)-threonylcarbamoyltransferase complex dimerization subunit type 1 TsaB [Lachnospiraceae bacterium]|nr:tRNA (adenosine(37)-N6)-threonylcarbamoyltransferase complex dimerization subunit type 1 TsaB [Lachnospiraceae bacterium]
MKLLAIDSSGMVASIAVWEDDLLLAEYTVNYKKTHSQTLLPMLDEVSGMIELDLNTVDAIAVTKGPGSFTGLRIGSATAKGLGLALKKPVVPVPTVDALAYNAVYAPGYICPIMDARRSQVYTGLYTFEGREMKTVMEQVPLSVADLAEKLNQLEAPVLFLGDGVPVYEKLLGELLTVPYSFAPAHMNRQRAGSLAALAAVLYEQGQVVSAMEYQPDYLRLSQAERERAEREAKQA